MPARASPPRRSEAARDAGRSDILAVGAGRGRLAWLPGRPNLPAPFVRETPMQAVDVMTRGVVSVAPDASVLEAVRLMLQHRISGLPVIDESGNLQGVVTEGDFLRRVETGT